MIRAPHSLAQAVRAVMCVNFAQPASYTFLNRRKGMFALWPSLPSGKDSRHA